MTASRNDHHLKLTLASKGPSTHDNAVLGHKVETWPAEWWQAGSVCIAIAKPAKRTVEGASDGRRPTGTLGR